MLGGLLDRFKEGLIKTRDGVFNRIRDVVRGKPRLDEETLEEIEDNLAFARTVVAMNNDRLQPMMSPHATDTHTPETMSAIVDAARELGTGVHIHLSQSGQESRFAIVQLC